MAFPVALGISPIVTRRGQRLPGRSRWGPFLTGGGGFGGGDGRRRRRKAKASPDADPGAAADANLNDANLGNGGRTGGRQGGTGTGTRTRTGTGTGTGTGGGTGAGAGAPQAQAQAQARNRNRNRSGGVRGDLPLDVAVTHEQHAAALAGAVAMAEMRRNRHRHRHNHRQQYGGCGYGGGCGDDCGGRGRDDDGSGGGAAHVVMIGLGVPPLQQQRLLPPPARSLPPTMAMGPGPGARGAVLGPPSSPVRLEGRGGCSCGGAGGAGRKEEEEEVVEERDGLVVPIGPPTGPDAGAGGAAPPACLPPGSAPGPGVLPPAPAPSPFSSSSFSARFPSASPGSAAGEEPAGDWSAPVAPPPPPPSARLPASPSWDAEPPPLLRRGRRGRGSAGTGSARKKVTPSPAASPAASGAEGTDAGGGGGQRDLGLLRIDGCIYLSKVANILRLRLKPPFDEAGKVTFRGDLERIAQAAYFLFHTLVETYAEQGAPPGAPGAPAPGAGEGTGNSLEGREARLRREEVCSAVLASYLVAGKLADCPAGVRKPKTLLRLVKHASLPPPPMNIILQCYDRLGFKVTRDASLRWGEPMPALIKRFELKLLAAIGFTMPEVADQSLNPLSSLGHLADRLGLDRAQVELVRQMMNRSCYTHSSLCLLREPELMAATLYYLACDKLSGLALHDNWQILLDENVKLVKVVADYAWWVRNCVAERESRWASFELLKTKLIIGALKDQSIELLPKISFFQEPAAVPVPLSAIANRINDILDHSDVSSRDSEVKDEDYLALVALLEIPDDYVSDQSPSSTGNDSTTSLNDHLGFSEKEGGDEAVKVPPSRVHSHVIEILSSGDELSPRTNISGAASSTVPPDKPQPDSAQQTIKVAKNLKSSIVTNDQDMAGTSCDQDAPVCPKSRIESKTNASCAASEDILPKQMVPDEQEIPVQLAMPKDSDEYKESALSLGVTIVPTTAPPQSAPIASSPAAKKSPPEEIMAEPKEPPAQYQAAQVDEACVKKDPSKILTPVSAATTPEGCKNGASFTYDDSNKYRKKPKVVPVTPTPKRQLRRETSETGKALPTCKPLQKREISMEKSSKMKQTSSKRKAETISSPEPAKRGRSQETVTQLSETPGTDKESHPSKTTVSGKAAPTLETPIAEKDGESKGRKDRSTKAKELAPVVPAIIAKELIPQEVDHINEIIIVDNEEEVEVADPAVGTGKEKETRKEKKEDANVAVKDRMDTRALFDFTTQALNRTKPLYSNSAAPVLEDDEGAHLCCELGWMTREVAVNFVCAMRTKPDAFWNLDSVGVKMNQAVQFQLPSRVTCDDARHLVRNFLDSPGTMNCSCKGEKHLRISRRELDIMLYFSSKGMVVNDFHHLMPYRSKRRLRKLFEVVRKMNVGSQYMREVSKSIEHILTVEGQPKS